MRIATQEGDSEARREVKSANDRNPSGAVAHFPKSRRTAQRLSFDEAMGLPEPVGRNAPADASRSGVIPTVFHEEWWLDAATQKSYSVVEVNAGCRTVGRLPFEIRRRSGLVGIWTPPLTHFLGPGVDEGDGSASNRFLRRLEITRELILKLPQTSWQCVRCHRGTSDVIAFQEQSFKTYAQFTYEIAPGPLPGLWQQMRNKTRNVIRRAQEQHTVCELQDPKEFVSVYQAHLVSRHIQNSLDLATAERVVQAALERNRGRILAARNERGEIVAANFCAWDCNSSFYIACTRREDAGNGASSLLLWEAIQHAAAKELTFDFAGLGTRGSVLHYAGFGGSVRTRFVAVRATGIGRLVARSRLLLMDEHFLF
jgi:hypothetical protein